MTETTRSRITVAEFEQMARDMLPMVRQFAIHAERIEAGRAWLRMEFHEDVLRPGGTISGPAMMTLADVAAYVVVLSLIGPVEMAVTTNLNINFLRRPKPGDLTAVGKILKLGKRLAVSEVSVYADGDDEPVCHVTATYSIPPRTDA